MSGGPFKFPHKILLDLRKASVQKSSIESTLLNPVDESTELVQFHSAPGASDLATLNVACSALLASLITHKRLSENSKPDEICIQIYKLDIFQLTFYIQHNLHA